jgi:hypothetical protein
MYLLIILPDANIFNRKNVRIVRKNVAIRQSIYFEPVSKSQNPNFIFLTQAQNNFQKSKNPETQKLKNSNSKKSQRGPPRRLRG